jgi:hypothetical protein
MRCDSQTSYVFSLRFLVWVYTGDSTTHGLYDNTDHHDNDDTKSSPYSANIGYGSGSGAGTLWGKGWGMYDVYVAGVQTNGGSNATSSTYGNTSTSISTTREQPQQNINHSSSSANHIDSYGTIGRTSYIGKQNVSSFLLP